MKDCIKASVDYVSENPNQRVNYPFGMVLGAADFYQEQAHFEWKHRLGARLLHGYGTVCGLAVSAQATPGGTDVEIRVSPGYAISPQGRWIWVKHAQCGRLNEWLQQHSNELSPPLAPGQQQVYVTLRYDECPDELTPIAGRACALEDDARQPSRITERFQLQFAWAPPPQPYEDALRTLSALLRLVTVIPGSGSPPGSGDDSELLLELVRNLGLATSPPLVSPPLPTSLQLWRDQAYDTLSLALTIWVTEVCPRLEPIAPRQGPAQDGALLLAGVGFTIDAAGNVAAPVDGAGNLLPGAVEIDQRNRPVLAPDRLKQALLLGLF